MSIYKFDHILKIFLIRHGQSQANKTPQLLQDGELDTPLTELGKEQAKDIGRYFKQNNILFDKVYSSNMIRAVETAKICIENLEPTIPLIISPEIAELSSAEYKLVLKKYGHLVENMNLLNKQGEWFLPPSGESLRMAISRVGTWFNTEIVYNSDGMDKDLTIAIVGHGINHRGILLNIMGFDHSMLNNIVIDNTGFCQVEYSREGWKVYSINNTRHLK